MTIACILAAKGREVVTTRPHRTLAEVAEVLVANNIGAVVVTDVQGSVLGILSEPISFVLLSSAAPPCSTMLFQCT